MLAAICRIRHRLKACTASLYVIGAGLASFTAMFFLISQQLGYQSRLLPLTSKHADVLHLNCRRDIRSLRDLTKQHIPFLKSIQRKAYKASHSFFIA